MSLPTVAIVGGGIAGLAAAWQLLQDNGIRVLVLEGSPFLGGKLRTGQVAGHPMDAGAESMLARRPEGVELLQETGLAGRIEHPDTAEATIWSRGRLWPLPPRTLMGVPSDANSARGILTDEEVERLVHERLTPPVSADISIGDFVGDRLGSAVVDRLVEPLLSGVYAGLARRLSLQASVPALWPAAASGTPVVPAAAAATQSTADAAGPVFAGYRGGLGAMATDLAARLTTKGVKITTRSTVRQLQRTRDGWRLTVGPTTDAQRLQVDGVVLALPARPASRLLASLQPQAAHLLAGVEYASVAIVTLALPRAAAALLPGSGFLVPPAEGLAVKGATFSSAKWAWVDHLDPDLIVLRASIGRAGETAVLQQADDDLLATAVRDLRAVLGQTLPDPVDADVQRWGGGLPQYAVGHGDRMRQVLEAVAMEPALALAGAAYEGLGIPACIASGRRAARQVAAQLRQATPARRQ